MDANTPATNLPVTPTRADLHEADALPILPRAVPATKAPLAVDSSIGELELLSAAEAAEFQECEGIVREGWTHFSRVGEALLRIRDKRLYRNEYHSFEVYCRERWCYGRSQINRYVAAAKVQIALSSIPGVPLPEFEAQVRPLSSLSPDLAQQAWLQALGWSSDGYVPARLVERAVRRLLKESSSASGDSAGSPAPDRQRKHRIRQAVQTAIDELQQAIMRGVERDTLLTKVHELQRLLEPLFERPRKQL